MVSWIRSLACTYKNGACPCYWDRHLVINELIISAYFTFTSLFTLVPRPIWRTPTWWRWWTTLCLRTTLWRRWCLAFAGIVVASVMPIPNRHVVIIVLMFILKWFSYLLSSKHYTSSSIALCTWQWLLILLFLAWVIINGGFRFRICCIAIFPTAISKATTFLALFRHTLLV